MIDIPHRVGYIIDPGAALLNRHALHFYSGVYKHAWSPDAGVSYEDFRKRLVKTNMRLSLLVEPLEPYKVDENYVLPGYSFPKEQEGMNEKIKAALLKAQGIVEDDDKEKSKK